MPVEVYIRHVPPACAVGSLIERWTPSTSGPVYQASTALSQLATQLSPAPQGRRAPSLRAQHARPDLAHASQ